jgi:serine/threonine-protein kinase
MITDFGIARLSRGPNVKSHSIAGTPLYMAPEQMRGEMVDGRADIYSAAVTLFEMLVSQLPLPKIRSARELLELKLSLKDGFFQNRPSELNPNVDKEMEGIVLKALSFNPEKRYASSRAFLQDLEQYQARHMNNQL